MIELRLLGAPGIEIDGEGAPAELRWRKNTSLLAYLACSPGRARSRDHLCGLLWPEKPEASARHSLNEALRTIRRSAGDSAIEADARTVALAADAVSLDLDALRSAMEDEDWESAGQLIQGDFMDGFGVPDCSDFEDWLSRERREWQSRAVQALSGLSEARVSAGDLAGGEEAARRALASDPLSDIAVQAVIRALALRGDRSGALVAFDDFAAELARHLSSEPAPETQRLADRVRRERTWRLPEAVEVSAEPESRLIARAKEMGLVTAAWSRCRRGEGGLILVEGEVGVGKTRLLHDLAGRARLDGAVVLAIRAVAADQAIPGSGIVGLCEGGLAEAPGVLDAPPGALAAVHAEAPTWTERWPDGFDADPRPLARAFSEVLGPVVEQQPVVLIVDDAQWIDEDSAAALQRVSRDFDGAAVLVVLAADVVEGRAMLDAFEAARPPTGPFERVSLGRWDVEDTEELIADLLPEYEADQKARLARRIVADSGGLPLLSVELATAVRDGLELSDSGDHGAWPEKSRTLDQTMPADLPGGVRAAIRVNFRTFSADAQALAAAASVVVGRFDAGRLAEMTGLSLPEAESGLDELERRRWVHSEPRGYGFVGRIVQQVVAEDMLTPGQRRRLEVLAEGT
jgi:DNA-binding SARP family transcriptional activator